jgi:predicted acylesterase/phospholipase RssA
LQVGLEDRQGPAEARPIDTPRMNAICFGGGGLVGTAKALGHLVGLDQIIRDPSCRNELKSSFFDYMADAQVSLRECEARLDEVFALIPPDVRNGRRDHLPRYFKVACGISGGSFLASGLVSGIPIVELVREALTFPVTAYFTPDVKEYLRGLKRLPLVPLKVAKAITNDLRRGPERVYQGRGTRWAMPIIRRAARLGFELLATTQDILPRGLFTGEGIERYIEDMEKRFGLANTFEEVRERGRYLFIISERFNAARLLSDSPDEPDSTIYFGLPPYDKVPVSRAIRASCSIPGVTTPLAFVDEPRGGKVYDLVDGAIGKTIGRRTIMNSLPIEVVVTINPIVPYNGPLNNIFDHMEQLYRKLIYSRLKAVEGHLEDEVKQRTIHLESKPDEFFYNMLRLDKMKEGLFEGYYQTLKYFAENYVEIGEKLRRGGLTLVPRTEIFKLVTKSSVVRERAYILKENRKESATLARRLSSAFSTLFMKRDPGPLRSSITSPPGVPGGTNGTVNGVQHKAKAHEEPPAPT